MNSSQGPSRNITSIVSSTTSKYFTRWPLDSFDYKVIAALGVLYAIIVVASIINYIMSNSVTKDYTHGLAALFYIVTSSVIFVLIFGLFYLIRRFASYITYRHFLNIHKK